MAKVKIFMNSDTGSANRIMGVFINNELLQSNDPREMAKRKKALKEAKKASGAKSSLSLFGWVDVKLKQENVLEIRQKGLTGKFNPGKKPITFSATNESKVTIKVGKRSFPFSLIFGKYNVSVKVK